MVPAAALIHLTGACPTCSPMQKGSQLCKQSHRPTIVASLSNNNKRSTEEDTIISFSTPFQVSRRAAVSIGAASILNLAAAGRACADEPGWGWIDGPLPVPTVSNKIANTETGTRSFLRNGIYIANIGAEGSAFRLKHYAFDLLALGDLLDQNAWNYFRKYLCLKSTIMYYDFDKVISAAPQEQKQPLTDLANRLFDGIEKLEDAAKKKNDILMKSCYRDTEAVVKEVMERMTKSV